MSDQHDITRYGLRLLVRHPSIDPDDITRALDMTPRRYWKVGTARSTPKGEVLPGTYEDTCWSWWQDFEGRLFSHEIENLITRLESKRAFLLALSTDATELSLILNLPGDANVGDTIAPTELLRLAQQNVALGIEVFLDCP